MEGLRSLLAKKRHFEGSSMDDPAMKYLTVGERERRRAEQIQQEREEKERKELEEKQRQIHELSKLQHAVIDELEQKKTVIVVPTLKDDEVMRRLRQRGEPIILFGEEAVERFIRLRHLEEKTPMEYSKNSGNEALAMMRTLEEVDKEAEKIQKEKEKEEEKNFYESLKGFPQTPQIDVILYFHEIIQLWDKQLENRTDEEKKSLDGRKESVYFIQCKNTIEPFFVMLRDGTLNDEISEAVVGIVCALRSRNYLTAESRYLDISIGNAPWPMGVTMVGIHERSAREKIANNQVAHIFDDEKTRKILQCIKRLISRVRMLDELHILDGTDLIDKKEKNVKLVQ